MCDVDNNSLHDQFVLKRLCQDIDGLLNLYEHSQWPSRDLKPEEIKNTFKLSHYVEQSVSAYEDNKELFMKALMTWWENQEKYLIGSYNFQFLCRISDHLLGLFFKRRLATDIHRDIAIRMYITLNTRNRFERFFKNLLLTSASYKAIYNFTMLNAVNINSSKLQYRLIHNSWLQEVNSGNTNALMETINNLLNPHRVSDCLNTILGILTLNETITIVQNKIIEILIEKMYDRSILSKQFWLSLTKCDQQYIVIVSSKYCIFRDSIIDFLVYIGSMFTYRDFQWIASPESICSEITFVDLQKLFINLASNKLIKLILIERIQDVNTFAISKIWNILLKHIENV